MTYKHFLLFLFIYHLKMVAIAQTNPNTSAKNISNQNITYHEALDDFYIISLDKAVSHYKKTLTETPRQGEIPRALNADGSLHKVLSKDWTSGFYPGILWFLYEYSNDEQFKKAAKAWTALIEDQKFNGVTHDMGFKIYNSYGNGFRLTKNKEYEDIIIQSSKTLITRFKSKAGIIRSWDHNKDKYACPVIIDNMMNLELLFKTSQLTNDPIFEKIAISHADKTLKNHFRKDNSSYHVVDYDTLKGKVIRKLTHQGYSNESAWARGQAWGLYGFTMSFRETRDKKYLKQAIKIADYILNHPRLPEDFVPYWDFDAPNIPNEPRDASAASIMASALLELSQYVAVDLKKNYLSSSKKILKSLSSENYFTTPNKYFLLNQSTGNIPSNSEINVPIIYADYYYLEALLRYKKLMDKS